MQDRKPHEEPDIKIDHQTLKKTSGEFEIESIHKLVLKRKGISDLGCIGECTGLDFLDLSENNLSKLFTLSSLSKLITLNLSSNGIQSLEGLQTLDNLKQLNLAGNLIGGSDALRCLSTLENLVNIRFKDDILKLTNPLCTSSTYSYDVTNVLPKLVTLDGEILFGNGSEVFKTISEINQALDTKTVIVQDQTSSPQHWVDATYWHFSGEFDKSSLSEIDQQLQDLLKDCTRLGDEVQQKVNSVLNKDDK